MNTKSMPTSKLLALDVGDARVGVAVGSAMPNHAEPFATLTRRNGYAESQILKLIEERLIDLIVVGMPYDTAGQSNQQCSKVEKFCRRLQRRTTAKFEYIDEYGSSSEADEFIATRPGRGADTDSIAAALILRRYLSARANG